MLPELGVIFDAGTGMFRVRDLIQTKTLDIFLSHAHLDHSVGLTFLYDILFEKDVSRVTVHLEESKIDAIKEHLFNVALFPVKPNFEFQPLSSRRSVELSDGSKIRAIDLEHPGGSHGLRLDWKDRSLAYITDTTAQIDADYVDSILDVDTLVHECYFADGWEDRAKMTGHSCLTPVAQVAAKAKAKRLFLVHINPLEESPNPLNLDSIKGVFADTTVAVDQMVIEV